MKNKNLVLRRVFMTFAGILMASISVGMFNFSTFGMDPFQVFTHGVWYKTSLSFGLFYIIINSLLLLIALIFDRKKIGLGTLLSVTMVGYIVDYSSRILSFFMPEPSLVQRIVFLVLAVVIMCLGSSFYYTADLGVSTYDAVALILSEKTKWKFKFCRLGSDLICTITGGLLGATVGIGTIVTALFMGPLISFFNEKIAIPIRYKNAVTKNLHQGKRTEESMKDKGAENDEQ